MPKLLIFAPCQTVLLTTDGNSSLINILHRLTLKGELPAEIPADAIAPLKWCVFAQWEIMPEETGATFEQRIQFTGENANQLFEGVSEFTTLPEKPIHRVTANFEYMRLGPAGKYRLKLSWRRKGTEDWIGIEQDFPMEILYDGQSNPE